MKHNIFLNENEINEICKSLGKQLTEKFKGKTPLFVGILKGYDKDNIIIEAETEEMVFAKSDIAIIRLTIDF